MKYIKLFEGLKRKTGSLNFETISNDKYLEHFIKQMGYRDYLDEVNNSNTAEQFIDNFTKLLNNTWSRERTIEQYTNDFKRYIEAFPLFSDEEGMEAFLSHVEERESDTGQYGLADMIDDMIKEELKDSIDFEKIATLFEDDYDSWVIFSDPDSDFMYDDIGKYVHKTLEDMIPWIKRGGKTGLLGMKTNTEE